MSLPIAASSGAATALPALNVHSHGHGHKKGADSATDSDSGSAAQIPAGSTQNLFGSLLTTLEQVIGTQPASGTAQPSATRPTSASTQTQAAAAASAIGTAAKSVLGAVGGPLSLFA